MFIKQGKHLKRTAVRVGDTICVDRNLYVIYILRNETQIYLTEKDNRIRLEIESNELIDIFRLLIASMTNSRIELKTRKKDLLEFEVKEVYKTH